VIAFIDESKAQVVARGLAISRLNEEIRRFNISELIFEVDSSAYLYEVKLLSKIRPLAAWDHRERHQEPLLWLADAVAWCVNRGGDLERLVRPMILETIDC
jgi:hypothetical protein